MRRLSRRTSAATNGSPVSSSNGYSTISSNPHSINGNGNDTKRASSRLKKEPKSISDLKSTMTSLRYDWPQVLKDDGNPIELAIALLDDSSVGMSHKLADFERDSEQVSNSLRSVVNEYHEIFNNSVGSYHYLLTMTNKNQNDCMDIKEMIESTSKEIHNKSDMLQDLNQTSQRYNEMIEILDTMEILNNIPYKIDQLVYDKKIHEIYDVIFEGYALAEKYNLWTLSAMASTKTYLDLQSNNLFDIIIDELQSEVYLKRLLVKDGSEQTFSWESIIDMNKSKLSTLKNLLQLNELEQFIYNAANLDFDEISSSLNERFKDFINVHLPRLTVNSTTKDVALMIELSSNFPSYYYIYQLVNTLVKLNRLNQVIEILNQSNQQEIHSVIYRSIEEIKLINAIEISRVNKPGFEGNFNSHTIKILKNLFSTVFIKSLAILQNQKILQSILAKFDIEYEFKNNWDIIKSELTSLMLNYITTETVIVKKSSTQLFKFANLNLSVSGKFQQFGDLDKLLYIDNETFESNFEVLVPITIYNMRIIMEFFLVFISSANVLLNEIFTDTSLATSTAISSPTMSSPPVSSPTVASPPMPSLARNQSIIKPANKTSISFFENFMKISFLPNLRNHLTRQFDRIMESSETSSEFVTTTIHNKHKDFSNNLKVFKNAYGFKKFILNLCATLNTSLNYRHELNDLLLSLIVKFLQSYQRLYGALIGTSNLKLNLWLKTPALMDISSMVIQGDLSSGETIDGLVEKEVTIMLNNDIMDVSKDDLLDDSNLDQLMHIIATVNWLMTWLPNLCRKSNFDYKENLTSFERIKLDWDFLDNGSSNFVNDDFDPEGTEVTIKESLSSDEELNIHLALDSKRMAQFDEIINNFATIKAHSLIVIRYNLRLKATYYIARSFKFNDWVLINEPGDSDEDISKFNKELFKFENTLNNYLAEAEINQILVGVSRFLNMALIRGSKLVKKINKNGIKRVIINIFTIQQMLKNLVSDHQQANFEFSSQYFEHFTTNENSLVAALKPYTKPDQVNLVRLLYSEKLADGNGSSFNTGKYKDLVNKLGA